MHIERDKRPARTRAGRDEGVQKSATNCWRGGPPRSFLATLPEGG